MLGNQRAKCSSALFPRDFDAHFFILRACVPIAFVRLCACACVLGIIVFIFLVSRCFARHGAARSMRLSEED